MFEKHTIRIVSTDGISQGGVKIGAMNLMIVGAKSLDIIVSVCPDFDDIASLKMTYQVRFSGPGFIRHPFTNSKKVERMHRVRCNCNTCSNFSELSTLLKDSNFITEVLECKRCGQPSDTASYDS